MPRKKLTRQKRRNNIRHRRAAAEPEVRALINDLRQQWEELDRIERGEKLRKLIARGCSTRGLAEALGISATGIRRYMTLAALPERLREAVRAGSSAKKILTMKAQADREHKRRERIALDARTGELSDELADEILEFCRTVRGVPETPIAEYDLPTVLNQCRNHLRGSIPSDLRAFKFPKKRGLKQRFQATRPEEEKDEVWIGHRGRWLANLIISEAPESSIWEEGIEKAEKRAKELRPKPRGSLVQRVMKEAKRKLEISDAPLARRY